MTRDDRGDKATDPLAQFGGDAGSLVAELALAGQKLALGALRAEMLALAAVMPGRGPAAAETRRRDDEAAIEAGFDNMPV